MSFIFYPEKFIKDLLVKNDIDYKNLYSTNLKSLTMKDKSALRRLSTSVYLSVMRTIDKINKKEKNKNQVTRENDKYDATIERSIIQSSQFEIMNELKKHEENAVKNKKSETMVKVLPSRAQEQDVYHARFYGRRMTLGDAIATGITTRYGCKCGLEIISNESDIKNVLKNFE